MSMDTDGDAQLRLQVGVLSAEVIDLKHRVAALTVKVGELLLEMRRLREVPRDRVL